tara:strand:- start:5702 stop:6643 length:942 start_codon:yes stop_codon:yes gene_type:complete
MSSYPVLLQSATGSITLYLQDVNGSSATGLSASSVTVDLKKSSDSFFANKSLSAPVAATADIGSGANGTVTVSVPGTAGNSYTVSVTVPSGDNALAVTVVGTAITVNLATASGVAVGSSNTATLIAAAVNVLGSEVSATASGTGADSISSAEGPTSLSGGVDGTFTHLGSGFYELDLTTTDTNALGNLFIRVRGSELREALVNAYVVASAAVSSSSTTAPTKTALFGYLYDAAGDPSAGVSVSARILSSPTVLHPGEDGIGLVTDLVTAKSDSAGFFSLSLIAGAQVDFFIPSMNYRRTVTVPSSTINVFDLP